MKISLLLPTLYGAGAHRMQLRLANHFAAEGHEVDFVLMSARNMRFADEISPEVRLVDLKCPRLWTSVPAFWSYLRRNKPDAVITAMSLPNGVAGWASRFLIKKPILVMSERSFVMPILGEAETPEQHAVKFRIFMKIIAFSYRFADHIVGVSKGVAERVLTVPGVRKERVSVIYNPSYLPEMEKAGEQEAPHPWLKDKTAPVVLGVGRLVPQKDFPTLIKAIHEVSQRRDVRLLIIGEGEDRAMLEAMIRERNLEEKVCLLGFQEKPWVYMAHTPVFCLSSTYEGFGNVVVEALACGTQVVSTDCPFGPAEILDYGRYGRLVPVGDASAMAKAIEGAIDQPIDREVLLGRAREFSVAHAANIYLGLAQTGR